MENKMMFKYLLLIFCAILLLDHSHGKSLSIETSSVATKETEDIPSTGLPWDEIFRMAVIEKLSSLSAEPVKLGIKLIEDTYADKTNNEQVNKFLARVISANHDIGSEEHARKIEEFLGLRIFFDRITTATATKEIALKEALEKHDVKTVAIEFEKKYNEFLEWLILKIDTNKNKFTSKGLSAINELKVLCQELNEEMDFVEKK